MCPVFYIWLCWSFLFFWPCKIMLALHFKAFLKWRSSNLAQQRRVKLKAGEGEVSLLIWEKLETAVPIMQLHRVFLNYVLELPCLFKAPSFKWNASISKPGFTALRVIQILERFLKRNKENQINIFYLGSCKMFPPPSPTIHCPGSAINYKIVHFNFKVVLICQKCGTSLASLFKYELTRSCYLQKASHIPSGSGCPPHATVSCLSVLVYWTQTSLRLLKHGDKGFFFFFFFLQPSF